MKISKESQEMFVHLSIQAFHSYPHEWQYKERESIIKMLQEHGYEKEANDLDKL